MVEGALGKVGRAARHLRVAIRSGNDCSFFCLGQTPSAARRIMMSLSAFRFRPLRLLLALFAGCLPNCSRSQSSVPLLPESSTPPATTAPASTNKPDLTPAAVAEQRAALLKEIAATRSELGKLPEGKFDDAALRLTQEAAVLERIDGVYVEEQRTLQHAADLKREADEVEERSKTRRPPEVVLKPPFGVELLDQLYAERDYLEQARGWLKTDVGNATEALREARDDFAVKERVRRTAREALDKASDRAKAQSDLRLAELESRLAQETLQLREKALATLKLQQSLLEPKQALLRPSLEWLRAHLVIADDEVAAARARRQKREVELDTALRAAKDDADRVSRLVFAAERKAVPDTPTEELDFRRADRQTANRTLGVLAAQRERLDEIDKIADQRRRVLGGGSTKEEMRAWETENRGALERLEKDRHLQLQELLKSRQELQDLQGRMSRLAPGKDRADPWLVDRVARLTAWVALCDRELADLDGVRTERLRLKEEVGTHVKSFSFDDAWQTALRNVYSAWNYEAFSMQDQPVRVKTILAVIALLAVGHWLSRRMSGLIGRAVFGRFGMSTGRRAAWETLSFYGLFLFVLLAAFHLFHLSLTQFSVVSGALAVGLGFGSQNLIGNFISGIILLVERPVNQGDVIELDGQQVTVERLGPRSTIVRSMDNTHIVVPNSRLLEQSVTNWTLSDDIVRRRIKIGVAYGSDTRAVDRIVRDVLASLDAAHTHPAPRVTFSDFGDNALMFEAQFWCHVDARIEAETELRHRITEAFTKAGIVMAFPQRDVHLDTVKPLQIEMVRSPESSPAKDPGDTRT